LPADIEPLAVIDHHPNWGHTDSVSFLDLRENYGATSTILTSYLQEIEVPIDATLATALFYGISAETQHLGRETIPADILASQLLYPYVDKRLLARIENPPLSRDYYRLINRATKAAVLHGDVVATILESVPYPDAVAEVADFLLRLESASWTFCLAPFDQWVYVSVRTRQPEARAGILLASLLPKGRAGGHGMMAGGLFRKSEGNWKAEASELLEAFLKAVGSGGSKAEPLVLRTNGEV
jgi:nanoRNase/pAp phosphatase (c-di-AMP/oligoRNAs hydrolase)